MNDSSPARGRHRVVAARIVLAVALSAQAVVLGWGLRHEFAHRVLWTESVALVLFVVALVALARSALPVRAALFTVVGVGLGLQLVGLTHGPTSSDDAYRYGWPGSTRIATRRPTPP